jgi:septal ring factor EnvC (AmiA/AmiB activator)
MRKVTELQYQIAELQRQIDFLKSDYLSFNNSVNVLTERIRELNSKIEKQDEALRTIAYALKEEAIKQIEEEQDVSKLLGSSFFITRVKELIEISGIENSNSMGVDLLWHPTIDQRIKNRIQELLPKPKKRK